MFPATIFITYNVNGDWEYQGFQTHDVSLEQRCMRTMHALYTSSSKILSLLYHLRKFYSYIALNVFFGGVIPLVQFWLRVY